MLWQQTVPKSQGQTTMVYFSLCYMSITSQPWAPNHIITVLPSGCPLTEQSPPRTLWMTQQREGSATEGFTSWLRALSEKWYLSLLLTMLCLALDLWPHHRARISVSLCQERERSWNTWKTALMTSSKTPFCNLHYLINPRPTWIHHHSPPNPFVGWKHK